jgi:hypothetical protein
MYPNWIISIEELETLCEGVLGVAYEEYMNNHLHCRHCDRTGSSPVFPVLSGLIQNTIHTAQFF